MIRHLAAVAFAMWVLCALDGGVAANQKGSPLSATATQGLAVSLGGKVKHPQKLDLEAPHCSMRRVGSMIRRPELRHVIRITGRDGYIVVLSTGEIAPNLGDKPAMLAYRRNDEAPTGTGFRLVMPGDKHGGRYVRDVVAIEVE